MNIIKEDIMNKIQEQNKNSKILQRICMASWGITFIITISFVVLLSTKFMSLPADIFDYDFAGNFKPSLFLFISETIGITLGFGAAFLFFLGFSIISTLTVIVRARNSSISEVRMRLENLESVFMEGKQ